MICGKATINGLKCDVESTGWDEDYGWKNILVYIEDGAEPLSKAWAAENMHIIEPTLERAAQLSQENDALTYELIPC